MWLLHVNVNSTLPSLSHRINHPLPFVTCKRFFVDVAVFAILHMHLSKTISTWKSIFKCIILKLPIYNIQKTHTHTHTSNFTHTSTHFDVEWKRELTDTIFGRYHQIPTQTPELLCCFLLCVQRCRLFIVIISAHRSTKQGPETEIEKEIKKVNSNQTKSLVQTKDKKAHAHTHTPPSSIE